MPSVSHNPLTAVEPLAAIAGADNVRATNRSVHVAPGSEDEVAAILRFAHSNQLPLTPWGGGTKQGWGNGLSPVIVLETRRLNQVREHTWQDMTCIVQAGCSWSALQTGLAQHGQFVALDPLWPDTATVGGIVATNDSGVLRLRYGSLRDLVIGMTIVLADGTIAKTGGKVVKNVAGYDLHKLMIGAFGTLGVVTSVNFRLHSLARSAVSLSVSSASAEPLGRLMMTLLHGQMNLVAMQLRGTGKGYALDIQLASLEEVLRTQAATLQGLATQEKLTVAEASADAWQARQSIMEGQIAVKATMLPTEIVRFASLVRQMGGISVTQATGIMWASFPATLAELVNQLRRDLESAGGSLMVLQQPPQAHLSCWGTLPDSLPLMREVKRQFDPAGVLNPGRFLGGI